MRRRSSGWRVRSLLVLSALMQLRTVLYLRLGLAALAAAPQAQLADALAADHPGKDTGPGPARAVGVAILERNIFDSQTGAVPWQEPSMRPVTAGSEQVAAQRPLSLAVCSRDLRLVASVIYATRPEQSFAALRRSGRTHLVSIGDRAGELSLLALFPTAAHVRMGDGEPCALSVYLPPDQRETPPPQVVIHVDARPSARDRIPGFKPQELENAIQQLGGSRYRVSRRLLLRALASPRAAGRGTQLRPVERHGSVVGFELSRLGKNSLFTHLGLQQGDLLRSINGHTLVGLAGLREALRLLRKNDRLTLTVMRGNVPYNLQYTVD